MMHLKEKNENGFSLVETLVAMGFGVAVTVMLATVTISGLRVVRETQAQERVHAASVTLVDSAGYWIKQSTDMTVVGSDRLELVQPDDTITVIEKVGEKVHINGSPITSDDVRINALTFTKVSRSVQIMFQVESESLSRTLNIQTTIAQRN